MPINRTWFGLVLALLACVSHAQQTSALINEALDQPVKLELNATLPVAMDTIADQTGVRLRATPAVWELLPWGQQTNITAKIENQTLRQALTAITWKLGLQYELKDEYIQLQPMPALVRLGRRATPQELAALDLLASTPAQLDTDRPTVRRLLGAIDNKLAGMDAPIAIENRAFDAASGDQAIPVGRNATMLEALEAIPRTTSATWYPWGKSIVILGKQDQVRELLDKTLTARYDGVDVGQVLMELSQRSGIEFNLEPGALQRIAPEFRNIRIFLDNASVRQALDTISGFTGLGYTVTDQGVYISSPTTGPVPARDPIVGIITLPDVGIQVLLPQSQVPEEVRAYLQYKTRKELHNLQKMMEEEGFTPPATQPSAP